MWEKQYQKTGITGDHFGGWLPGLSAASKGTHKWRTKVPNVPVSVLTPEQTDRLFGDHWSEPLPQATGNSGGSASALEILLVPACDHRHASVSKNFPGWAVRQAAGVCALCLPSELALMPLLSFLHFAPSVQKLPQPFIQGLVVHLSQKEAFALLT